MKIFTTIKIGYTAGIYGCSGEYFNTIIIDNDKIDNILHYGLYGSDERVNRELEELGYSKKYVQSDYGKMTQKDINKKAFKSEYQAIEWIKQYA